MQQQSYSKAASAVVAERTSLSRRDETHTRHNNPMSKDTETTPDRERSAEVACSADAPDFITELRELLNRRSMENDSDTPDFILASYLTDCLRAWNHATKRREGWYGRMTQKVDPPNAPKSSRRDEEQPKHEKP